MDDDVRKLMLIAAGLGIFFFGLWTLALVFGALMAESGGKKFRSSYSYVGTVAIGRGHLVLGLAFLPCRAVFK